MFFQKLVYRAVLKLGLQVAIKLGCNAVLKLGYHANIQQKNNEMIVFDDVQLIKNVK